MESKLTKMVVIAQKTVKTIIVVARKSTDNVLLYADAHPVKITRFKYQKRKYKNFTNLALGKRTRL